MSRIFCAIKSRSCTGSLILLDALLPSKKTSLKCWKSLLAGLLSIVASWYYHRKKSLKTQSALNISPMTSTVLWLLIVILLLSISIASYLLPTRPSLPMMWLMTAGSMPSVRKSYLATTYSRSFISPSITPKSCRDYWWALKAKSRLTGTALTKLL